LEPAIIEPVDQPVNKDWADAMAFNETLVTIMVHETTDKTANPLPDIYVNGVPQRFFRGKEQDVKWKFVEVLARAKKTSYTQHQEKDANGDDVYVNDPHTALEYPFSLVRAPSQLYFDKLKAILAEA
jgi:hypothetical protein